MPPQHGVSAVSVDGAPAGFSTGTEAGWSWLRLDVDVPRGATVTLTAQLSGPEPVTQVRSQPLVRPMAVELGTC